MDFRDSPAEAEYRKTLRNWLDAEVPRANQRQSEIEDIGLARRDWHRTLYEAGYAGQSWPVEWGGRGLSPIMDAILNEEAGNFDAPTLPGMLGYLGRALVAFGTDVQKQRFLPPTLSGQLQWCQGFSEPDAGSDLASLRTRADRDGDVYVVNGVKLWTSGGQYADWCILLARTDITKPKHRGITAFLVDMTTPGITVNPIRLANGTNDTCEVIWADVRVPVEMMLGQEGQGWHIAMSTLAYERGASDVGYIATFRRRLAELQDRAIATGIAEVDYVRSRIARVYVLGEALRTHSLQQLSSRDESTPPGPEGSVNKLLWTECEQELEHLSLDLFGPQVAAGGEGADLARYFSSRQVSVYGGSTQIQKNIIAQRLLGMRR